MQIWIHDRSMRKVCALNNEIPGILPYTNSQWHTYFEYSTSTFDFMIPKIVNGKLHDDIKYINDQMYVSFYYDNSYHVFYVAKIVDNDMNFQVTCNNTNLELAMETARPLASSNGPQKLEWYLQNLDLLGFAGLEVGFNEVSDETRTITFESQSGTKLEQLHSLMNQFDAEFVFRTDLNRDGTLKKFVIDIYHRPDENHHGIGKVRGDVTLYYQTGLKGVQVTSDKTQLFNLGYFVGQDGVNLNDVEFEEKNELGQVEFYSKKGSSAIYAPLSMEMFPSTINEGNGDRWTRKDFQTEYKDVNALKAYALRTIKQYAYPLMTYTVDVNSSFIENYKDINLGDSVKIINNNFIGGLALESRVSEMIISFDMPKNNSVVFTNYRKLDNRPSGELQQRIGEIVSKSLPYQVEIRTTNGTVFKNGVGHSTVKPILKQGDKIVNATYRFVIDGTIKYSGMTYDMVASEITQPTALTVSAFVDNKEVASKEITFLNISDGKQGPKGERGEKGPKGDRGNDGLPGKDGVGLKTTAVTYGLSDSDSTQPTNWTSQPPTLIKGKYLWTKTVWTYTDSSIETGYQKTYIAKDGKDGNDGIAGKDGVGIKKTTITYAQGTSGTVAPTNGWSSQVPNVPADQYLWTKTVWGYTDGTNETGYSVAKMGKQGPKGERGEKGPKGDQGIPGPKGADGKTQYTHIAYADTISGSGFSQTDTNKAYIGMYQDFNAEDSNNPQDYRWSKWKGSDGKDGIPGKAGADGRTPYVHFAYADSADGRTGFSLTQTGSKRYLGVLTNFIKEDSTNPSDYTWNDTAGSVSVGGDNLITNSSFPKNLDGWGVWETGLSNENLHISTHKFYYNGARNLFRLDNNGKKEVPAASRRFKVKRNTDYSFNIQIFATGNLQSVKIYFLGRKANETGKIFTKAVDLKTHTGSPSTTQTVKWHLTFNSGECDEGFIRIDNNGTTDGSQSMLFFAELDCYEGTTDRSWQASPKDLKDEIDTKADNVLTQAQLNKLSETNSVMKAELEAKASLDTLNQWVKAYQDFVNANSADRAQAEKSLADASARVAKLENNLNDMSERWNFIDNYMAASNDGFVIGKKDNSSSIMFNPNGRISMFSAGNEVMYISQGVIHIENGIFSKTVQIGRFREEQDIINPDRNVIRYVGGA
ncbi:capsid and scaffold protein [Streptococcus phage CHPC879]|uniref:Capsid and scaffold protein n=1 Tax=Streptococcus phage CHPC879 TaxID=2365045 RepID=A0A3G8FBZ1_9CAUD|nr:capsid and scaffold protein [Streptococcus phage CHPC879]AZF92351.1 capsid and scaffold protein [Streptococcus phage CHPC879]